LGAFFFFFVALDGEIYFFLFLFLWMEMKIPHTFNLVGGVMFWVLWILRPKLNFL